MNSDKLFATIVTALTILSIFLVSIWIFSNNSTKAYKNFVSKKGEAIAVSLASPTKRVSKKHTKRKSRKRRKVIKKHTIKKSKIIKKSIKLYNRLLRDDIKIINKEEQ